ncbi:MAG: chromate transporter [Clostridiales bacterium]|nr:chromate transporter [Clostridiales bacterium]
MLTKLFFCFMEIGLMSIGGGYVAMPLIQSQTVTRYHWLTMGEFADLVTIAEMTPGPIGINAATFVGMRLSGIPGAIVASLGFITPSTVIVSLLALLYTRYKHMPALKAVLKSLKPVVVAMIASAGIKLFLQVAFGGEAASFAHVDYAGLILFASALVVLRKWKPSPILVLLLCGVAGLGLGLLGIY